MITSLTEENKKAMPHYVDKWRKVGVNTDRLDYAKTVEIIDGFMKEVLDKEPLPVVIAPNPIEAWVMCHFSQYQNAPADELAAKVDDYFAGKIKMTLDSYTAPYQDGSFFSPTFAFYDYMFNELKVPVDEDTARKYKVWEATSELGLIFPLERACIVSEKPKLIKLNEDRVLHCDGGPALSYGGRGGMTIYALNGVRVDEYLAVTPHHELSLDYYNTLKNADVKTEFVRKFGVERMLDLGEKIDTYENYSNDNDKEWWRKSEYELWDMKVLFEGVDYAPHLKMLNQTTKVWHIEAVSPACRNLSDAMKERFGGSFDIKGIA